MKVETKPATCFRETAKSVIVDIAVATDTSHPRMLRNPEAVAARRDLLQLPHVAPLTAYVAGLRLRYGEGWEFPESDPLDGGINGLRARRVSPSAA